jgi:hypothetical protein
MAAYSFEHLAQQPVPNGTTAKPRYWRHDILTVLLGLIPVIPMPIAGGFPIHVAVLLSILGMLTLFSVRELSFDRTDRMFLTLVLCLYFWESIAAMNHGGRGDVMVAMGRGFWALHCGIVILAINEIYRARGLEGVARVLVTSLVILIGVMIVAMIFFPKYTQGRQFGFINIPFPRTTGAPNSDGKIGTFLTICLAFGYFARAGLPWWQRFVLLVGPWLGLMATQSRSTLAAILVAVGIHWIYSMVASRQLIPTAARFLIGATVLVFMASNLDNIRTVIVGEGIYERNYSSRAAHVDVAIERIPQSPLFGLGGQMARVNEGGAGIHNTFLNLAVKSGMPSTFLLILLMFFPLYMFGRTGKTFMFAAATCFGLATEHLLYPGVINEHIVLSYATLKYACFELQRRNHPF